MTPLLNYDTYVETDYSRFDMTISLDWIKVVQDRILTAFFPEDHLFQTALTMASKTKGVSECGLTYDVAGTRCSGDAHTSIANGILNSFNTDCLFSDIIEEERTSDPRFMSVHEGDDGVIALGADDAHLAARVYSMDVFGFVVKAFITQDINMVSFCGRFLCDVNGGISSFCDPYRTLAKLNVTLSQGKLKPLLLAKMMSYSYTDGNTPIIGPIAKSLVTLMKSDGQVVTKRVFRKALAERYLFRDLKVDFKDQGPVIEGLRAPFALRTGISPADQIRYEEYFTDIFSERVPSEFQPIRFLGDITTGEGNSEVHFMPSVH